MNKIIPFTLLFILLGLLGGYLFVYKSNLVDIPQWKIKQKETTVVPFEEQKNEENNQAEQDATNYNNAIKEKRLDLCDPIMNTEKKSDCRDMISASEALTEKNPELCGTLTNTGIKERCLDNIAYFVATEAGESSLCQNILDDTIHSQCIKSIEELNFQAHMESGSLDVGFCETLTDSELSEDCKRKITTERDSEFYRKALADSTLTTCDNITDPVTKSKCRDAVLFDLALKEGNLDYCGDIVDTERSDYCRKSLLGRQDVSRYQQFVRTGNLESCNELSVIQMKNQCHDTIVFAKVREIRDEGMCDLLYNTGIISQCREMLLEDKNK